MNQLEHFVRFPLLQRGGSIVVASHGAQLMPHVAAFDAIDQAAFHRQVEPLLGARLQFEIHARRVTQSAHQPNRLIGERVNREHANFLLLQVGQAVHWIQQQAARLGVQ